MPLGWVYSGDFLLHDTGDAHVEQPCRLEVVRDALADAGLLQQMRPIEFGPATPETIATIHDPAYIDLVRMFCDEGMTFIGSMDTRIGPRSYDVARLAVGGILAACDAVMSDIITRAFCALRPPGHHAERDQAMGFCIFNNVAIAAERLIRRHHLQRVAIVDFDVHHGNGTQHAFEDRDDVLYISLHQHPGCCYPGTGYETEIGTGAGQGFTLNIPLYPNSDDRAYRAAFAEKVIPRLDEFRPQFLLLSAGFDATRHERIAHINLDPESFEWMTRDLVDVANAHCGGKLVSALEGGYALQVLGQCAVRHLRGLL